MGLFPTAQKAMTTIFRFRLIMKYSFKLVPTYPYVCIGNLGE